MHVRALIIIIGISLAIPAAVQASEGESDDPHSVGRDGYFLQFGWDAGADLFAGVGRDDGRGQRTQSRSHGHHVGLEIPVHCLR